MTEQAKQKPSFKERLHSVTPWGIAEKKMQRSVQNVAAAMTLDVVKKTREFSVEEAVPLSEDTQALLVQSERDALAILEKNRAIN